MPQHPNHFYDRPIEAPDLGEPVLADDLRRIGGAVQEPWRSPVEHHAHEPKHGGMSIRRLSEPPPMSLVLHSSSLTVVTCVGYAQFFGRLPVNDETAANILLTP